MFRNHTPLQGISNPYISLFSVAWGFSDLKYVLIFRISPNLSLSFFQLPNPGAVYQMIFCGPDIHMQDCTFLIDCLEVFITSPPLADSFFICSSISVSFSLLFENITISSANLKFWKCSPWMFVPFPCQFSSLKATLKTEVNSFGEIMSSLVLYYLWSRVFPLIHVIYNIYIYLVYPGISYCSD